VSSADRQRWDAKYAAKAVPDELEPDAWLVEQVASLPPGHALEPACGLGHNAIWLAQQGWQVDAVDVSPVGLRLASELADRHHAKVHWIASDLDEFTAPPGTYDLILVFRFLDRARLPAIIEQALRPGGRLLYETFTLAHISRPESHMKNQAFALAPGELPELFPRLATLSYSELTLPDRDVARLVAQRRTRGEP